jgi:hypothetical protein
MNARAREVRKDKEWGNLRLEAQVDHAVGLVQHDVVALVEHRVALLQAVQQPPGRRDHDLAALRSSHKMWELTYCCC